MNPLISQRGFAAIEALIAAAVLLTAAAAVGTFSQWFGNTNKRISDANDISNFASDLTRIAGFPATCSSALPPNLSYNLESGEVSGIVILDPSHPDINHPRYDVGKKVGKHLQISEITLKVITPPPVTTNFSIGADGSATFITSPTPSWVIAGHTLANGQSYTSTSTGIRYINIDQALYKQELGVGGGGGGGVGTPDAMRNPHLEDPLYFTWQPRVIAVVAATEGGSPPPEGEGGGTVYTVNDQVTSQEALTANPVANVAMTLVATAPNSKFTVQAKLDASVIDTRTQQLTRKVSQTIYVDIEATGSTAILKGCSQWSGQIASTVCTTVGGIKTAWGACDRSSFYREKIYQPLCAAYNGTFQPPNGSGVGECQFGNTSFRGIAMASCTKNEDCESGVCDPKTLQCTGTLTCKDSGASCDPAAPNNDGCCSNQCREKEQGSGTFQCGKRDAGIYGAACSDNFDCTSNNCTEQNYCGLPLCVAVQGTCNKSSDCCAGNTCQNGACRRPEI